MVTTSDADQPESKLFVGAAITAYVVAIGAIIYLAVRHNGLAQVTSDTEGGWDELLDKLPAALRVAVQNIAIGSDGGPANGLANLVSWLILAQCLSYIALGIGTLLTIRTDRNRNRGIAQRHRQ